jgi:hypothetical protein
MRWIALFASLLLTSTVVTFVVAEDESDYADA